MLNAASTTELIGQAAAQYSSSALIILGYVITIGVALIVCYWGWHKLDNSAHVGGFYLKSLPFRGYHRFRSKRWNMEHMQ